MSEDRLQKILARAGVASRRKAEELIRLGQVTINGRVAELGEKADPERDSIKVEGKRVQPAAAGHHHYLLLNKPKGVVSTLSDPEGRTTVLDLIPPAFHRALVPVGRLDYNTEGLLLLTDDGEFAQRLGHPRFGSVKVYEVKVQGRPKDSDLIKLRSGILLEGKRTAPCKISPLLGKAKARTGVARRRAADAEEGEGSSWWKVELTEGRTRQIREMFFRIGHSVQKLRRVAIGPLHDRDLPVGASRELTEREVAMLLRGAKKTARRPRPEEVEGEGKAPARAAKRPAKRAAGSAGSGGAEGAARRPHTAGTSALAGAKGPRGRPKRGAAGGGSQVEGAPAKARKAPAKRPAAAKPAARPAGRGAGPKAPSGARRPASPRRPGGRSAR